MLSDNRYTHCAKFTFTESKENFRIPLRRAAALGRVSLVHLSRLLVASYQSGKQDLAGSFFPSTVCAKVGLMHFFACSLSQLRARRRELRAPGWFSLYVTAITAIKCGCLAVSLSQRAQRAGVSEIGDPSVRRKIKPTRNNQDNFADREHRRQHIPGCGEL